MLNTDFFFVCVSYNYGARLYEKKSRKEQSYKIEEAHSLVILLNSRDFDFLYVKS